MTTQTKPAPTVTLTDGTATTARKRYARLARLLEKRRVLEGMLAEGYATARVLIEIVDEDLAKLRTV